jgi:hypothetical protein
MASADGIDNVHPRAWESARRADPSLSRLIVPGKNRFENALFPGDNQGQKLLDAAHCVDGGVASL